MRLPITREFPINRSLFPDHFPDHFGLGSQLPASKIGPSTKDWKRRGHEDPALSTKDGKRQGNEDPAPSTKDWKKQRREDPTPTNRLGEITGYPARRNCTITRLAESARLPG